MGPGARPRLSALCLLAGGALPPGLPAQQARPEPPQEEILVELAVASFARRTVSALADGERLLLPIVELLRFLELPVSVDSSGVIRTGSPESATPVRIDPHRRRIRVGETLRLLDAAESREREGVAYLSTAVLESFLGARFAMDWASLRLDVEGAEPLPVARRIERERSRRLATGPPEAHGGEPGSLMRGRAGGAVLDWSIYVPGGRPPSEATYRLGLGTTLLGGSLEFRYARDGARPVPAQRLTGTWLAARPEGRWLRQVGLGEVVSVGPRPLALGGALVTNSPFIRSADFALDTLAGALRPGAEVELYRNGELVAYSTVDPSGAYRLPVDLRYGLNAFELRTYDLYGAPHVRRPALRVDADRLPAGVLEYGLGAGACRLTRCRTAESADLAYGLAPSWTMRAGLVAFQRDSLADLFQPYARLVGAIGREWRLRGEALARGLADLELSYEPTADLGAALGATAYDPDVEAPILTPSGARSELRSALFWRPFRGRSATFLNSSLRTVRTATGRRSSLQLGLSARAAGILWAARAGVERISAPAERPRTRGVGRLAASGILSVPGSSILDRVFARAVVDGSTTRPLERAELALGRSLAGRWRIEARGAWATDAPGPLLELGVVSEFPWARTLSRVTRQPTGEAAWTNLSEGSLVWNPGAARIEAEPGRGLRRGGVAGTVFLDENADGRRDAEESPLPGIRILVGDRRARTDDRGRFVIWDLVPFDPLRLTVDSLSLPHPLWTPALGATRLAAAPNAFREIEIPIVQGAELEGRIRWRGGPGIGGVPVRICPREGEMPCRSELTFGDGEFYLLGLPPGEYDLELPPDAIRDLGARAHGPPVRFTVRPGPNGATAPFLDVELRRLDP